MIAAVDALSRAAAILLAAILSLILLAQIVFRYGFNSSILWSEEVSTWCMVWMVFLGSASIMRRWQHVDVPLGIRLLPLRWRPAAIMLAKLLTLLTVSIIAWYGIQIVMGTFHIRSQTTNIDTRWIKLAVPVGSAMMALCAVGSILDDLRSWRRGDLERFRRYGEIGSIDVDTAHERAPGT